MMMLLYLVSRKSSCSSRSRMPSVMNFRAVSLLILRSYLTCAETNKPQSAVKFDAGQAARLIFSMLAMARTVWLKTDCMQLSF